MTRRPLLVDLFSCAGGASVGYRRAGFDVVGVDNVAQPHYPFPLHVGDALWTLTRLIRGQAVEFGDRLVTLADVSAFAASPPCQAYTAARTIRRNEHPELIVPTRNALDATGRPWIIENVPGAPLRAPVELCGAMFAGLNVYRHRLFESNVPLTAPAHVAHAEPVTPMGRQPLPGHRMTVVGNFSGVAAGRRAMGIEWGTRDTLREAIPPAYTEHLGRQLMAALAAEDVAA